MNTNRFVGAVKRIGLALAVCGTLLYATSSCALSDLLTQLGLTTGTSS